MKKKASPASIGRLGTHLMLGPFRQLKGELAEWRRTPLPEVRKGEHRAGILDFVWGLRLSAHLIYALRTILSTRDLEVDWGHVLQDKRGLCSPECDVIVHTRGEYARWNGRGAESVMDFKFIDRSQARAVVSCKSLIGSIDKKHCENLRGFVPHVFLFGECCEQGKAHDLKEKALAAGYDGFCCLYEYDKKNQECVADETEWKAFLDSLGRAVSVGRRTRRRPK